MPRVYKKCRHGKQKSKCVDCDGAGICKHKRVRAACKACNGKAICPHGKQKSKCVDCDGSGICQHGKQKDKCGHSKCSGCMHDRMNCFICDPEGRVKSAKYWHDWNAGVVGNKHKRD